MSRTIEHVQERLRITTLGRFELRHGPRVLDERALGQRRSTTLLKLVASEPTLRIGADILVDRLWPESSPTAGRTNLRVKLHEARTLLRALLPDASAEGDASPLVFDGTIVAFDPRFEPIVDARTFEEEALEIVASTARPAALGRRCEATLAHFGGPYLPGETHESIVVIRERLDRTHRALLRRCADAWIAARQAARYEAVLARAFAAYPDDGWFAERWIAHMLGASRTVEADDALRRHTEALEPSGGAPVPQLVERVRESMLRRQRLSCVDSPTFGRDAVLERLDARLATIERASTQVVTIGGLPGVGKSRLLVELGARARARGYDVIARTPRGESVAYGRFWSDFWTELLDAVPATSERARVVLVDDVSIVSAADVVALERAAREIATSVPTHVIVARSGGDFFDAVVRGDATVEHAVVLEPLEVDATRDVVRAAVNGPACDALVDAIADLWPGNLATVAAVTAHAVLAQLAVRDAGRWTLAAGTTRDALLPEIVRRQIVRRLSRLPKLPSDATFALAFAGRPIDPSPIAVMLDRDAGDVRSALDALVRGHLVTTHASGYALQPAVEIVATANLSRTRQHLYVGRLASAIETFPARIVGERDVVAEIGTLRQRNDR